MPAKVLKKSKSVQKALAPEERTVIENIASLTGQLLSASDSEEVVMAEDEDDNLFEEDEDEVLKANEGPTADEKAEDRVDANTEETEENYSEVGKKVGRSIVRQVNKSLVRNQENTAIMETLTEITKALKGIADRQTGSETAIEGIIEGLGITKSIAKEAGAVKTKTVPRGSGSLENAAILTELTTVLKGIQATQQQQVNQNRPANWDGHSSHDALREAGPSLLGRA